MVEIGIKGLIVALVLVMKIGMELFVSDVNRILIGMVIVVSHVI